MNWHDFIVMILIGMVLLFAAIMMGCATCRKTCCPERGHGPCPMCNVIYDSGDIIYGRKR